jgi:hypothetical protein
MAETTRFGSIIANVRGGNNRLVRIQTSLLPASITQTPGMLPNCLHARLAWPSMTRRIFSAAVLAISSVGKPVFGTPNGTAPVNGLTTRTASTPKCRHDHLPGSRQSFAALENDGVFHEEVVDAAFRKSLRPRT